MRDFVKEIKNKVLLYDGSKEYMLQKMGLRGGECSEFWNITHKDEVKKVYDSYKNSGCDVIQTNTFPGNRLQLEKYSLGEKTYEINYEGARLAREVMGKDGFVAASIGPTGKLFEPAGDLTFNVAYEIFKEQIKAVVDGGVDIINLETFMDIGEIRAALLAAKDVAKIPVICSMTFESHGKTLMGSDPYTVAVILKSLGADMIGANCSLGHVQLLEIIKKMHEVGGVYLCVKPNAGLPEVINGEVVFKEKAESFAELASKYVKYGVRLIGGCCGTTPEFIKAIAANLKGAKSAEIHCDKSKKVIASHVKHFDIEKTEIRSIGLINSEKDKELAEELEKGNFDFIIDKALELSVDGYDVISINVDSMAASDEFLLSKVVNIASGYIKEPLIIETQNPKALDDVLRLYKGRAGVIIDDSSGENKDELIVTANKYGSVIIGRDLLKSAP